MHKIVTRGASEPMKISDLIRELIQGNYRVKFEVSVGSWLKPAGYVWNGLC